MSPPRSRPWRVAHPHVPGPDHTCPGSGVPAAAVLAGPAPKARTSRHRRPAGLLRRARPRHTPLRLIDPRRGASPPAATRGSSAPCSPPPSPPCAPTPSPGPTTNANETKANRLGPGRPHPGPPPHPDPARHDPRWSPLRPTTINTATHRRLTHHIEAPHDGRVHDTQALRRCGLLDVPPADLPEGASPPQHIGDKGYIGPGMITPRKKPANLPLHPDDKACSTTVNQVRHKTERVIANIKT